MSFVLVQEAMNIKPLKTYDGIILSFDIFVELGFTEQSREIYCST